MIKVSTYIINYKSANTNYLYVIYLQFNSLLNNKYKYCI